MTKSLQQTRADDGVTLQDGFDVSGNNVWIHDCVVWNQDDSFCVKDGSTNMVFERINASGVGLTIGSIGDSVVKNITFRDAYMQNSIKVCSVNSPLCYPLCQSPFTVEPS